MDGTDNPSFEKETLSDQKVCEADTTHTGSEKQPVKNDVKLSLEHDATSLEQTMKGAVNLSFEPDSVSGEQTMKGAVNLSFEPDSVSGEQETARNKKVAFVPGFLLRRQSYDVNRFQVDSSTPVQLPGAETEDEEGAERQQWSHPIEFFLSCVAMSVGLGNIWRFPTTAFHNGGGAFLIPYLVVLTFLGRPMYFMELALGQFSSFGCVKMWKVCPAVKGVGYGQMLGTWSVVTYYCALMAISIFYFVESFQSTLPWSFCHPEWADNATCVSSSDMVLRGNSPSANFTMESSSEQYFLHYVIHQYDNLDNGIGAPDWKLTLCLLFSWAAIFLTLAKGVQSSGKVAYFTALFPYVVLIILLIRGVTLPGSSTGILYFITPQWHKLLDPNVWFAAITQSFFSLSVAFGSIPMFASYNDFRQNIYRDAWIISLIDTLTSLLAGFTIFSILGNLAYEMGLEDIKQVARSEVGLVFISYPEALAKFDVVPQLFSVLFFLMLFTLGIGSAVALTGCVITVICDQFPAWNRLYVTFFVSILGFLIGLIYVTPGGLFVLDLINFFGGGFIIFALAIIETVAVHWIYGINNFTRDIKFMLNVDLGYYWKICWVILMPVGLSVILVYSLADFSLPTILGEPMPTVAYVSGWLLVMAALLTVPAGFYHSYSVVSQGSPPLKKLKHVFEPKPSWGPKKPQLKREWEAFVANETKLAH